jgi:hypothetical protein
VGGSAHRSRDACPHVPSLERACPGPRSGNTGWVDRQRYRRLVPFPFYPSQSPLSRGETEGRPSISSNTSTLARRSGRTDVPSLERARPGPRSGNRRDEYMGNEIIGWCCLFRRSLFDRPSPWPFDGSGPHARPRVPSPEGEGQEEGMEKPPSSGGSTLFNTASPLSKRETQWPKCFMEGERPPLAQRSGPSPLPGEGGTGWVDEKRYQRLMPPPFYPSFSPLSRGET